MFEALPSDEQDDAALELIRIPGDDVLQRIAGDAGGREVLLRCVRELGSGVKRSVEERQMQRIMRLVTRADRAGRTPKAEAGVEVEVITYLRGKLPLDAVGTLFGARGHTALMIGNLAYSFEKGWSCGQTRSEYIRANQEWRDGVGQILKLTAKDVRTLQDTLNKSCGTGYYAISGKICTDATGAALQRFLKGLRSGWDPGAFIAQLEATGKVKSHRFYPHQAHKK